MILYLLLFPNSINDKEDEGGELDIISSESDSAYCLSLKLLIPIPLLEFPLLPLPSLNGDSNIGDEGTEFNGDELLLEL
ncbi:unnamed protein product [[Candida] boidinii]|nr:unnamed protein product [[Candida] boidinii]